MKHLFGLILGFALLAIIIMIAGGRANAHPQDRDLINKNYSALGFNDPVFAECWFDYWHERRQFVLKTVEYAQCVGALEELVYQKGYNPAVLNIVRHDILNYWEVIPAVPVLEAHAQLGPTGIDPKNGASRLDYCKANVEAAVGAINDTETWLGHCAFWRWFIGVLP